MGTDAGCFVAYCLVGFYFLCVGLLVFFFLFGCVVGWLVGFVCLFLFGFGVFWCMVLCVSSSPHNSIYTFLLVVFLLHVFGGKIEALRNNRKQIVMKYLCYCYLKSCISVY